MAVLSDPDRAEVAARFQRVLGNCPGATTKPALLAAVVAIDDWLESNAAEFNAAIPTAFRNAANSTQKNILLQFILNKRLEA